jgi:hypothetical protein
MNTVRITAGGSPPLAAGLGAQIRVTELDANAHANESPSSTNTRFIYRFMCEGKMCVRILRPDQANRIKQIFDGINRELPNQVSKDGSSLKGRVTAINFVADSIQIEKADGNKDPISLSSLQGDNRWYELAVNELVGIVRGKMVGSSLLEDRKSERARSPNQAETTHFCFIPGRFFGSTPIDLSQVGCGKKQKLEDYLEERWCTENPRQPIDKVFTSELETIKKEMQKQYRNQPLTREMEKECKIEARSRAVAVELLRTGSDEARIALLMKLAIENNLPFNTPLNLRTPLDHAMAQKHSTIREPDILHSVKLSARSSSEGESSLTEEEANAIDERFKSASASGGATERSSDDSEMLAGDAQRASNNEGNPDGAEDGLVGRPRAGSIVGIEDRDLAKRAWTHFLDAGEEEAGFLNDMRDAAATGGDALKRFLTGVLDDSSELNLDLLIQYLNKAVKEAPEQSSKFQPDSLVAVLKEAWRRGPGPSESTIDPAVADSKQFRSLNGEKLGDKEHQDLFEF